ncbi:MAG: hypothetical protein ACKOJF_14290, partial [Planctomycetaceae bacterium]
MLPVLPRDEEPQPTTQESMFSYVRLSAGGPPRSPGPRSEVAILAELGRRVLGRRCGLDWEEFKSHAAIRQLIAETIPGLEPLARIEQPGQVECRTNAVSPSDVKLLPGLLDAGQ